MFVIVVSVHGKEDFLYEGRSVFWTDSILDAKAVCSHYSGMTNDPDVTYTLCQVTPIPQEGP